MLQELSLVYSTATIPGLNNYVYEILFSGRHYLSFPLLQDVTRKNFMKTPHLSTPSTQRQRETQNFLRGQ